MNKYWLWNWKFGGEILVGEIIRWWKFSVVKNSVVKNSVVKNFVGEKFSTWKFSVVKSAIGEKYGGEKYVEFQVKIKGWDIRVIPSDLAPSCWDNVPSLTDFRFGNLP